MKDRPRVNRRWRLFGGASAAAVMYAVLPSIVASAAIFTATILNTTNTFSSGNLLMSGTTPTSVVCTPVTGSISGSNSTTCSGNPLPSAALSTTASSAVTTLTSVGSLSGGSGLLSSTGCGLQYFNDLGGNGNYGFPFYGVTLGTTMSQLSSTAATYDGSTGWTETNLNEGAAANFTITGWFKTSANQGTIVSYSNAQANTLTVDNDRELWIDSAGHLVWATATSASAVTELTSPSTYTAGTWNFFAASISSSAGDRLYVNGAEVASNAATTAYNYNGYWHFGWGAELDGAPSWTDKPTNAYFNGSLNGLAIFPSPLTTAQISTLYGETTQSTYNAQVSADGVSFYWPMTDSGTTSYTGTVPNLSAATQTFADASGNANTGNPEGTVTTGATGPTTLGGNAVSLPGTSGSDIYTTKTYANPTTLSASIWFKTTSQGSIMGANTSQGDGTPTSWDRDLWIDPTGHLVFGVNNAGNLDEVTSPGVYNDGNWHFVVVSYGSSGEYMYVDGSQVAFNSAGTAGQNATIYWHLGFAYVLGWGDTTTNYNFNGTLAAAGLFSTQLTSAQVTNLYNATSADNEQTRALALSPLSYWPLTDMITQTFIDASGNSNTGDPEGTVTTGSTGPTTLGGNAVTLPGTSGNDIDTTRTYSNPTTLSASIWFKTTSQGAIMGANTTRLDGTPGSWDRDLWIDPTGHLVFGINDAGTLDEVTSPGIYDDGNWHFVVVSYGSLGEYMYVDGSQVAYNSAGTAGQNYTMFWHLGFAYVLGWGDTTTDYNFNGSLAQAGLYSTQLSQAQVTSLYSAPSFADEETRALALSPLSYWPLTDSTSSSACALIYVTVQTTVGSTTSCVVPAGSGACGAPTSAVTASNIGSRPMTSPATGAPVTVTVTMKLGSAAATGVAGLHVLVPLLFYESLSTFSSQLSYPSGVAIL